MMSEREPGGVSRRSFIFLAGGAVGACLLDGCSRYFPAKPSLDAAPEPTDYTSPTIAPETPPSTSSSPVPGTLETTPVMPSQTTRSGGEATSLPPTSAPATSPKPPATTRPRTAIPPLPSSHYIPFGPPDRPNVSITIDDFSSSSAPDYLSGLLQIGKQKDASFTLFPIGQALERHDSSATRSLWRQAIKDGHVVGNHTWDHDEALATKSASHIASELGKQHQMLNKILGTKYDEYLMRPPGGSGGYHVVNPKGAYQQKLEKQFQYEISVLKRLGYWLTMWGTDSNDPDGNMVTPGDTVQQEDDRFLHKIFYGTKSSTYERVRGGSIILVHPATLSLNGMSRLIDGLHSRGYNCVSVPEQFSRT